MEEPNCESAKIDFIIWIVFIILAFLVVQLVLMYYYR